MPNPTSWGTHLKNALIKRGHMLLKDFFDGFIISCQSNNKGIRTVQGHKEMIRKYVGPTLGEKKIDELRLIDIDLIQALAMKGGKSRPRSAIITYRRVLYYIKRCGHRLPFDIEDVEVPKYIIQKPVEAFTLEETLAIKEYLKGDTFVFSKHVCKTHQEQIIRAAKRTRCLFDVMLHAGLRIGEAVSINRFEDLDLENNKARIKNVKTHKWETVYLHGAVASIEEYLSTRTDNNPALFLSNSGKPLGVDTAKSMVSRLKKKLGLKKNLTNHIWRKTFITMLLKYGKDPKKTQKAARHASLQTTLNHYYALEDDEVKDYHEEVMARVVPLAPTKGVTLDSMK